MYNTIKSTLILLSCFSTYAQNNCPEILLFMKGNCFTSDFSNFHCDRKKMIHGLNNFVNKHINHDINHLVHAKQKNFYFP